MAIISEPAARRGRRLLAAIGAAACLFSASSAAGGTMAAHAAPGATQAPPPCGARHPCPTPTVRPTGCPLPDFCLASPSPNLIEVSPVPPDPIPSPSTPSYLVGISPPPSPVSQTSDSATPPVPVAGGFVDQLPTPTAAAGPSAGDSAPRSSGLPVPLLAAGVLFILGAIGSLIYALAPRYKPIFETVRPSPPTSPVLFTPYGPDSPSRPHQGSGPG